MRTFLAWLAALAVLVTPLWLPDSGRAHAALSVAIDLDALVAQSQGCVIGRVAESRSEWVELGGGRRIVTYTRLEVERTLFGRVRKNVWVRTLGGAVDGIGQVVSGEARLRPKQRALVFLHRAPDGVLAVTALAQGHFPIVDGDAGPSLAPSPDPGTLVRADGATQPAAGELLVGRSPEQAALLIAEARARHATP